jgi:hypothetical protein
VAGRELAAPSLIWWFASPSTAHEDDLRKLAAEALGEVYFRDGGRRAHGLEVELKDIVDLQFEL